MKFAAGNAQHVGARARQEDAFGFSDPTNEVFTEHAGFLGVVADGMGGMSRGREASQIAVRTFLRAYDLKPAAESIPDSLLRSVMDANNAVLSLSNHIADQLSGTTLAAAIIHKGWLHWISAGDSRIYLLRDGRLTRLTADHIYGRELDEKVAEGKISRIEARSHPERGSLTSYLGMKTLPELDRSLRPFPLRHSDCIVVCSDGFYRALSEIEIVSAFRGDLNSACDDLTRKALQKQRVQQDNLTVIALSDEPNSSSNARSAIARATLVVVVALLVAGTLAGGVWRWIHRTRGAPLSGPIPSITLTTGSGTKVSGTSNTGSSALDPHPAIRDKKAIKTIAGETAGNSAVVTKATEVLPAAPSVGELAGSNSPTGKPEDGAPKNLESADPTKQSAGTPKQPDGSLPQGEATGKHAGPTSLTPVPSDRATEPGSQADTGPNTGVSESKGDTPQAGTAEPGTPRSVEKQPEGPTASASSSVQDGSKKTEGADKETHKNAQDKKKGILEILKLKRKKQDQKDQQ